MTCGGYTDRSTNQGDYVSFGFWPCPRNGCVIEAQFVSYIDWTQTCFSLWRRQSRMKGVRFRGRWVFRKSNVQVGMGRNGLSYVVTPCIKSSYQVMAEERLSSVHDQWRWHRQQTTQSRDGDPTMSCGGRSCSTWVTMGSEGEWGLCSE